MRFMIAHNWGASTTNRAHLESRSGPFDTRAEAIGWAFTHWGPSGSAATLTWVVEDLFDPEETK